MNKRVAFSLCAALALSYIIIGCGSSGSTTNPAATSSATSGSSEVIYSPQTGRFVDDAVKGLAYECKKSDGITATTKGTTGANGEFLYAAGDSCTFKLGDIILGAAQAVPVVTPYTLYPYSQLAAINVARFLQTLDEDINLSNGISIASYSPAAKGMSVDFSNEASLRNALTALVPSRAIVNPTAAKQNLDTYLATVGTSSNSTSSTTSSTSSSTSSGQPQPPSPPPIPPLSSTSSSTSSTTSSTSTSTSTSTSSSSTSSGSSTSTSSSTSSTTSSTTTSGTEAPPGPPKF